MMDQQRPARWAEEKQVLLEELSGEKEALGFALLRLANAEKEASAGREELERLHQQCDSLEERARQANLALQRTQLLLLAAQKSSSSSPAAAALHYNSPAPAPPGLVAADPPAGVQQQQQQSGEAEEVARMRAAVTALEGEVARLQGELDEERVTTDLVSQANDDLHRQLRLLRNSSASPSVHAASDDDDDHQEEERRGGRATELSGGSGGDEWSATGEAAELRAEIEDLRRRLAEAEAEAAAQASEAHAAREEAARTAFALETTQRESQAALEEARHEAKQQAQAREQEEAAALCRQQQDPTYHHGDESEKESRERDQEQIIRAAVREEAQTEIHDLKKAAMRLETKLRRTEKQLDAFRNTASADAKAHQQTIASLQAKALALAQQNQQLQQQIATLPRDGEDGADVDSLNTIRAQLQQAQLTVQQLRAESDAQAAVVQRLEQELRDQRLAKEEHEQQLDRELFMARQAQQAAEEELARAHSQLLANQQHARDLEETHSHAIHVLQATVQEKDARLSALLSRPPPRSSNDSEPSLTTEVAEPVQEKIGDNDAREAEIARLRSLLVEREARIQELQAPHDDQHHQQGGEAEEEEEARVSLTATEEDEEMLTSLRHDLTLAASETARWREACVVLEAQLASAAVQIERLEHERQAGLDAQPTDAEASAQQLTLTESDRAKEHTAQKGEDVEGELAASGDSLAGQDSADSHAAELLHRGRDEESELESNVLIQRVSELEAVIQKQEAQLRELTEELRHAQAFEQSFHDAEQLAADLRSQVDESRVQNEANLAELNRLADLQRHCREVEERAERQSALVADHEQIIEELRLQLQELEQLRSACEVLRQQAGEEKQRADNLATLVAEHEQKCEELGLQLSELTQLRQTCEERAQQVGEEKQRADSLAVILAEREASLAQIESQLRELEQLRQACEEKTRQAEEERQRADHLATLLAEREQQVEAERERHRTELEAQAQRITEEEKQQTGRLTHTLAEREATLAEAEARLRELDQMRQACEEARQRAGEWERLAVERAAALAGAEEQVRQAQADAGRAEAEAARQVKKATKAERKKSRQQESEEVKRLREAMRELTEERDKAQERARKASATAAQSPSKVAQWQKKAAELKKQLEEAQRDKAQEATKLKEAAEASKKKAQREAKEKAVLRKAHDDLVRQLFEAADAAQRGHALQEELDALRKQSGIRDRKYSHVRQKRDELQAALLQSQQDHHRLEQELISLRLETQQHQTHIKELDHVISELRAQAQRNDAAYLALKTEFAHATRSTDEEKALLEKELEDLRTRLLPIDQSGHDGLEETLTQLQDLKTLNHEILDLLESEKEQHRAVLGELQLVKEQLAAEKGSHAFTLEQLANEQTNLEHAQQFTEGLKADLERAQQQLADTLTLQNEKIEELHATISTLRSQKDALQHQLRELHTENGRLSRERGDSDASIAALTKHIRELKSAPASTLSHSSSTSVLEAALTKEREEHAATRKQLSDHKKTAHTMRVEFLRGHVADLEQLHEAQEVIRLFLEAQKHHLASHYSADASCPGELPAVERPQFDPSQLPNPGSLLAWEEKLPQQPAASLRGRALRAYCEAVIEFIRRPNSEITQREMDEHAADLAAALEHGESRERLKKIHANTLLLKRIIASYYKEFAQLPLLL